jgi:hypothetical protein
MFLIHFLLSIKYLIHIIIIIVVIELYTPCISLQDVRWGITEDFFIFGRTYSRLTDIFVVFTRPCKTVSLVGSPPFPYTLLLIRYLWSQHGIVGIATGVRAGRSNTRILVVTRDFFKISIQASGPTQLPVPLGTPFLS